MYGYFKCFWVVVFEVCNCVVDSLMRCLVLEVDFEVCMMRVILFGSYIVWFLIFWNIVGGNLLLLVGMSIDWVLLNILVRCLVS